MVIEIPKALSLGNVAVRCIFTNYDHLSEKSRLFYPRPKKVPYVVVEKTAVAEVSVEIVSCYSLFYKHDIVVNYNMSLTTT